MKRIIPFSRYFIPAAILSGALIVLGIVGLATMGLNRGVDFQAGINQTVQLAYPAISVAYTGRGNADLTVTETGAVLVFSGAEVEARTLAYQFQDHPTIASLASDLSTQASVTATVIGNGDLPSSLIVPTFQGTTLLEQAPSLIHRIPANPGETFSSIDTVRTALATLGAASIQQVRPENLQRYLIRLSDDGTDTAFSANAPKAITDALEAAFGEGRVVVMKTDYVGARYSANLARQVVWLILFTTLVILLYATVRFKIKFAIGSVIAILHDGLIMVAFIVWTRMEFNTSTIAAILTILGYSINDTIVQFDRIREDRKLRPNEKFVDVLNQALSETLGRTIITTVTTLLAVLALIIFTSGSMRGFAVALFVGMISGTYSTIFIASGFVL